ncbi:MAG: hypothetical protein RR984_01905, partial [Bacilli bacterium]
VNKVIVLKKHVDSFSLNINKFKKICINKLNIHLYTETLYIEFINPKNEKKSIINMFFIVSIFFASLLNVW